MSNENGNTESGTNYEITADGCVMAHYADGRTREILGIDVDALLAQGPEVAQQKVAERAEQIERILAEVEEHAAEEGLSLSEYTAQLFG